jgi:D-alanyl-lipoteichoic acid acyltransferase DltB (MBOAT superfamily)
MTFLPSFIGGPLLSYREFQAGRLATYWEDRPAQLGELGTLRWSWVRMARGVAAALATLPFVPVLSPNAYTAAMAGPLHAWSHAIAVYLAVYLGFSAWSEAAIGSGRLAGIVLPENFQHAHFSYGVADFWRRWNVRLGWWMREYVDLPLGGGRRKVARNLAAVFLATAVYHHIGGFKLVGPGMMLWFDFYVGWLGWAALNMLGTLWTRHWRAPATFRPRDVAIVVGTVLFSCVALQRAFFPAGGPAGRLLDVYKALVIPARP